MQLYDTLTRGKQELPPPPARSACTSAARPSTSARTSATRGRTSSACGCGAGCVARGYDVTLVHNITDVNDKIYEAAPGASAELAARATQWYLEDTDALGLGRPDALPKATRGRAADRPLHLGADRPRPRVRVGRRRLLPRRLVIPSTDSLRASVPTRSKSRSRTRARRIRATSRSGRRTSRKRTRGGTRRGAAAVPAGTSSAP